MLDCLVLQLADPTPVYNPSNFVLPDPEPDELLGSQSPLARSLSSSMGRLARSDPVQSPPKLSSSRSALHASVDDTANLPGESAYHVHEEVSFDLFHSYLFSARLSLYLSVLSSLLECAWLCILSALAPRLATDTAAIRTAHCQGCGQAVGDQR